MSPKALEILETKRLTLTRISSMEMDRIFRTFSKEEIKKILGHRSNEEYEKELHKHQKGYAAYNREFNLFLLHEKSSGLIIGRCGLHNWNREHYRAELGYHLLEEYRNQGLMSEAAEAVIRYGFQKMDLNRIEALVGSNNLPSLKIIQRFKFRQEGLLRGHHFEAGSFEDSLLFSLLRAEFINKPSA